MHQLTVEKVECPLCCLNISLFNLRQRDEHVNICLEAAEQAPVPSELPIAAAEQEGAYEPCEGHKLTECKEELEQEVKQPKDEFEEELSQAESEDSEAQEDESCATSLLEDSLVAHESFVKSESPAEMSCEVQGPVLHPLNSSSSSSKRVVSPATRAAKRPRKAPYFKILNIGGSKVAVDAFAYGDLDVSCYYLTHFHSDHYGGLGRRWARGDIYCTPTTARLVILKLGVDPKFIKPLELDVEHTVNNIKVRFLDANHCPGAAIILFNNNVLHTGDFRASPKLVENVLLYTDRVNTLYLDTTYMDPARMFPAQTEVINICAEYCQKVHTKLPAKSFFFTPKPVRILVIVGTYTIGKERLAIKIAQTLGTKIWATADKRRILDCFGDPELDALLERENGIKCQVHLAPMHEITIARLEAQWRYLKKHYTEIIAFCPTGWTFSSRKPFNGEMMKTQAIKRPCIQICKVPYSEHSSFTELKRFCEVVKSTHIIPTVSCRFSDVLREWEFK